MLDLDLHPSRNRNYNELSGPFASALTGESLSLVASFDKLIALSCSKSELGISFEVDILNTCTLKLEIRILILLSMQIKLAVFAENILN